MKTKSALLIVDMQNDLCPGGALAVPQGDKIIPRINTYAKIFSKKKLPIFASCDWHPVRTKHFKDFGGTWPVHCIANTKGAALHHALKLPKDAILLYKGMDPAGSSDSVFQAEDDAGRSFSHVLEYMGVEELYVGGLATEYCITHSVLEALKKGIKIKLMIDAIQGVNLKPDDAKEAIALMKKKGAKTITLKEVRKKR